MKIEGDDGIVVLESAKRTSARSPVLRKGPLKCKRIEVAQTTGIEPLQDITEDFMLEIFGFEPGEYLITDLSSLQDVGGVDAMEIGGMRTRIRDAYRIDVADLPNGNLVEILSRRREHQLGARTDERAH